MERLAPLQSDTLDDIPEPAENPLLVGHDDVFATLVAAYRAGKLPHALLFVGRKGIGKATLAFHLANFLLRYPNAESVPATVPPPQPGSALFRQIATGAHPGVLHLTRPFNEKTKTFKSVLTVDEIRRINRFLSMTSHDGGYRIVIIDPADDMNVNAANALLKNLEEPPARTLFVLIANSLGALLPTIRSRCQVIRFTPLDPEALAKGLAASGLSAPAGQDWAALAERAGGSIRRAILLTEYGGLEIASALERIVGGGRVNPAEVHKLADAVSGRDQAIQFGMLNDHTLDLLGDAARAAALAGDLRRADRLSAAWQELRVAIGEAETYNLDRKQHALTMILQLSETFRM